MQDKSVIQSIEKAALVLALFSKEDTHLTLNEIMLKTAFSKTTVFRLCNTLEKVGFLEKIYLGNTPYYRLGIKLFNMGNLALKNVDLVEITKPYLKGISDTLGDTGHLFIVREKTAYCLLNVEGTFFVKALSIESGDTLPLNLGGAPISILAFLSKKEQQEAINSMNLSSEDQNILIRRLEEVRNHGYSISKNEVIVGTAAVGSPIFNHKGDVIAAISVGGLVERFSEEKLPNIIEVVVTSAKNISLELGCAKDKLLI